MGLCYRSYEYLFVPKSILEKQFISIGHSYFRTTLMYIGHATLYSAQYFTIFYTVYIYRVKYSTVNKK